MKKIKIYQIYSSITNQRYKALFGPKKGQNFMGCPRREPKTALYFVHNPGGRHKAVYRNL
jgi:hypothetical protein